MERMDLEMKSRGFSRKTIKVYLFHVERFLAFTRKDPEREHYKNKTIEKR